MLEVRLVSQMLEDALANIASSPLTTCWAISDVVVKELRNVRATLTLTVEGLVRATYQSIVTIN